MGFDDDYPVANTKRGTVLRPLKVPMYDLEKIGVENCSCGVSWLGDGTVVKLEGSEKAVEEMKKDFEELGYEFEGNLGYQK